VIRSNVTPRSVRRSIDAGHPSSCMHALRKLRNPPRKTRGGLRTRCHGVSSGATAHPS
jgi:hypothetical protein